MLRLHVLPPAFGLRNPGPFAFKCELALRHLGLEFDVVPVADPRSAPKGKLPYLVEDSGSVVADSELILLHLDRKTNGGLYGALGDAERAEGVAFTRLAEEHLYWIMVASRWLDDEWWPNVVTGFFGGIPAPMRRVVAGLARRQVRQTYHLQGLGRHTLSEQKDFARRDLDALAGKVASSPYLLGDAPSVFDFGIAALLAGTLDNEPATWMTEVAREFPPVVDHAERVQTAMGVHCRAVE